MKTTKSKTPWSVFIAIILAFFIGNYTPPDSTLYSIYDLIGTLFTNSLTMVVVPLVLSSIILGISKIGMDSSFKRLGCKIFGFFTLSNLSAILIALFLVNLLQPGASQTFRPSIEAIGAGALEATSAQGTGFFPLILSIIPPNIFQALAKGEMLAIIFFALLFGYALSKLKKEHNDILMGVFQGLFQAMISITHIIMKALPLGVFCLVAKVAATTGFSSLSSLALFFITVIGGLLIFSFVILPLYLKIFAKVSPIALFRVVSPALITAFSTSSSAATLPITMDCLEKQGGISNRICSLVIPLGTSLNMSGSALYECVGAMFVAQAYGVDFSFSSQIIFVFLALFASMGVVGIPAASLIAIMVILKAFGLPPEGIGLFIAVDRILDMCRTTVNVLSDICCTVLVAKSEGETTTLNATSNKKI